MSVASPAHSPQPQVVARHSADHSRRLDITTVAVTALGLLLGAAILTGVGYEFYRLWPLFHTSHDAFVKTAVVLKAVVIGFVGFLGCGFVNWCVEAHNTQRS